MQAKILAVLWVAGLAGLAALLASWRGVKRDLAAAGALPAATAQAPAKARTSPKAGKQDAPGTEAEEEAKDAAPHDPLENLEVSAMSDAQKREAVKRILRDVMDEEGKYNDFSGWDLTEFDPGLVWSLAMELWPGLTDPDDRRAILDELTSHPDSPFFLDAVELGMQDADPSLRERAMWSVGPYSFRQMRDDPDGWRSWCARMHGLPLDEVCRRSAAELVVRIRAEGAGILENEELFDNMNMPPEIVGTALRESGFLEAVAGTIGGADDEAANAAMRNARFAGADEEWLRRVVLPELEKPARMEAAISLLAGKEADWAIPVVAPHLRGTDWMTVQASATFLAGQSPQESVPLLIDALRNAANPDMARVIGQSGLEVATGIPWHRSHDAAWWGAWWEENKVKVGKENSR